MGLGGSALNARFPGPLGCKVGAGALGPKGQPSAKHLMLGESGEAAPFCSS